MHVYIHGHTYWYMLYIPMYVLKPVKTRRICWNICNTMKFPLERFENQLLASTDPRLQKSRWAASFPGVGLCLAEWGKWTMKNRDHRDHPWMDGIASWGYPFPPCSHAGLPKALMKSISLGRLHVWFDLFGKQSTGSNSCGRGHSHYRQSKHE